MRRIIFFILLLISISTQAQTKKRKAISVTTLTTRQLSVVTAKLQADFTDSIKYLKDRIDVYLWQNDRLNQRQTATEKWRDSAGIYYNPDYFDIDSNQMLTPKERIDTFIIIKKSPRVPGQTNTINIHPMFGTGERAASIGFPVNRSETDLGFKPQHITTGTPGPGFGIAQPYKFETDKPQQQQDIDDLKWQIEYFEKLLDDDKKVMDRQLQIIKEQQNTIEELKKIIDWGKVTNKITMH